jgi:hypothetical protein
MQHPASGLRRISLLGTSVNKHGSGLLAPCARVGLIGALRGPHLAYEDDSFPSSREVISTTMTATKNNGPPSSTLVMTVLVLRTNQSRKP